MLQNTSQYNSGGCNVTTTSGNVSIDRSIFVNVYGNADREMAEYITKIEWENRELREKNEHLREKNEHLMEALVKLQEKMILMLENK